ncbi:inner membrane protein YiaA [Mesonia aquimarina]|uniref:inner membrane protein YiaA n=1 Tax=Mesonia aquimarina TaxID=1504967 RepID=UPI000EF58ECA|nr:inner membrane protein YiaA [Mesonia aquimarina]
MENQEFLSEEKKSKESNSTFESGKPTPAFVTASWIALFVGMAAYCIGLWNADMWLNEKGYYFAILIFGLFSVISVQKSVRDKQEGIPVTEAYHGLSWFTSFVSILLLIIGLWHADLALSEKGFYGMAFTLSLYASISIQKNVRDLRLHNQKR